MEQVIVAIAIAAVIIPYSFASYRMFELGLLRWRGGAAHRLLIVVVTLTTLLFATAIFLAVTTPARAQLAPECNVTMPCVQADGYDGYAVTPVVTRGNSIVHGRRPPECRVRIRGRLIPWCGCWLGVHLGKPDRDLWLARNWATVGRRKSGPCVGCIVVWRNHVGIVTDVDGNRIRVLSGNDGNRVRERWRSAAGVIAWRAL